MHTTNFDISLEELSKIEGAASCQITVRDGEVTDCRFGITEMRRFFMQAIRGKPMAAVPSAVSRICGTCSNAHLLASLKAIENGLGLEISPQTKLLRELLNYALIIRDHALHLYVFALPDILGKDSILAFDEKDPTQHQLLHDCFDVKEAGNRLAIAVGGRSVHAPFLAIGGFVRLPAITELEACIPLISNIRPAILRLIGIYAGHAFTLPRGLKFLALADPGFTFLNGSVRTNDGRTIPPEDIRNRLTRLEIPHSQATGYRLDNESFMVGALARLNINKDALHPKTKTDAAGTLAVFPSNNIYYNNLAQAIEILHAIDTVVDILNTIDIHPETAPAIVPREAKGVGIIEAPRGTLYHEVVLKPDGTVADGHVIVPTGQNQICIEESIKVHVTANIDKPKELLEKDIEKIVRAYDPCMSCATHFLKFKWKIDVRKM